jgi:hypothetical protein
LGTDGRCGSGADRTRLTAYPNNTMG